MVKPKRRAATRRQHLTERRIEAMTVPSKRSIVYDVKESALGLKLEPSGRKVFFWFRAVAGKPTWKTIGRWPDISLDTAREKAQEYNVTLAKWQQERCVGPNPFTQPRSGEQPTFGDLIEDYVARHVMLGASYPDKAANRIRWTAKTYLTDWLERRLGSITRQDVFDLHRELGLKTGKVTANRVCQLVRTLFNWGTGGAGLWRGENPAAGLEMFEEPMRERFLQPDELLRLKKALVEEPNRDLRDFVILSLATGQRRGNIYALAWADISWDTSTWQIKRAKNKKPYLVSLSPTAVKTLKARAATREADNPWVFPSPSSASGHAEDFKNAWKQLLIRADLYHPEDDARKVTPHDLRRTFASYMAIAGVSLHHIGSALGHLSTASTTVYARLHREAVKESIDAGNKKMYQMMKAARKRKALPASA